MNNRTSQDEPQDSQRLHEEGNIDSHEHAPLLGHANSLHHARNPNHHTPGHAHFAGDDPATARARRRRRLFLFLAGTAILVVLGVIAIVGSIYGHRIRRSRGANETPDYSKLPPPQPGLRNPSYLVRGEHGAVATETETCSQIGIDILKDGGKATDAAIGSALCVGVVNMFSSGIGGGGFLVIRPSSTSNNTTPISIDFRETSPSGSHPNMYVGLSAAASRIGGLAIGIPGELRGYEAAYDAHGGGVTWERIFQPAIKLAEEGWAVTAELDRRLKFFGQFMLEDKEWSSIFVTKDKDAPGGKRLKTKGEWISRPAYGRTLRVLAAAGADAFYTGPLADSSIATIKATGGRMTHDDLRSYKAIVQPAIKGTYHNRTIYTTHAPSAGPVLIHLLNVLEKYNFPAGDRDGLSTHRFIEALKFAFARRTSLGDPAFAPDQEKRLKTIMSKSFAEETLKKIDDDRTHSFMYYGPEFAHQDDHGTTHLSVVDSEGSAVALTTTVNLIFGSRVMDPKTGIIFNDEQDDFATPGLPDAFGLFPSPYNFPDHSPTGSYGKRPLSSTSAAIIDDEEGEFWLALGGSGGSRIFGAVAQVLLNLDWGYDLLHAIEEPRVHDQLLPEDVSVESGLREDLIESLHNRGHNITRFDINLGIAEVQAVMKSADGFYYGASDSRKNGVAKAY